MDFAQKWFVDSRSTLTKLARDVVKQTGDKHYARNVSRPNTSR
jgi:hypothetical protein